MKLPGCVFISTPSECRYNEVNACRACGYEVIECILNHDRLVVANKHWAKRAWADELSSSRRTKTLAGQEGRVEGVKMSERIDTAGDL